MARTGSDLITDLRVDLDSLSVSSSTWTDPSLLRFLNEAANKVASVLRQEGEGYLEKTISYTDADFTVYGSTYSPVASLVRATGAVTITVPENCVSIKSILPVSQSQLDAGLSFLIVRTDNVDYKSARRRASATFIRTYYCVFEGLTTLRFAPALQEAVNLSLVYVALPQRVDFNKVIDGIPEAAYQALLVYAGYRALWSIKHEDVNVAYQMWQAERKELIELLANRDAQEMEVVQGMFEDYEDDYAWDL